MLNLISFNVLLECIKSSKFASGVMLTDAQKSTYAGHIEDALIEALDIFWPKLLFAEQRTPVAGLIAWAQTDQTVFDKVEGVYRTDPTLGSAVRVAHRIVPEGVQVAAAYGPVWIRFMEPASQLSGEEYSDVASYNEGSVVVDQNGHCYRALVESTSVVPSENSSVWKLQPIPLFLKKFLKLKVRHQVLSEDDGKWTALRDADTELDRLCLVEFDQQGQQGVSGVRC